MTLLCSALCLALLCAKGWCGDVAGIPHPLGTIILILTWAVICLKNLELPCRFLAAWDTFENKRSAFLGKLGFILMPI